MRLEQKKINKNYILNNLDKYVIDSRQNFYSGEVEIEYSYINKDALPDGAFEQIRDKIYQKIIQNKYDWEITDNNSEVWHIVSTPVYQHKTTDMSNHSAGFTWEQNNRLGQVLSKRKKNSRRDDNPSPRPQDDDDNVVNRRRQTAIDEIEDQFAASNITIDEIEELAREHVAIENVAREQGVWPLSEWKSIINRLRRPSEISDFHYSLQGFIHAIATCRDRGDYERIKNDVNSRAEEIFDSNWYEDWKRSNDDYLQKSREDNDKFWRDFDRRNREESQRQGRGYDDWRDDWLRKRKEKAIDEIEEYLVKKNVSAAELNKKIRKSDWKQEINKFYDFGTERIFSKQLFLQGEIDKINRRFTCAGCGRIRDDIYSPHEEDGKKFCINVDCWNKFRKKEEHRDDIELKNPNPNYKLREEIRDLKSFLEERLGEKRHRVGWTETMVEKNPLALLLEWMRKEGITNISLDKGRLVVDFGNQNSRTLNDNELTPEQAQLKEFFRNNPQKPNISRRDLEQEAASFLPTSPSESDSKAGIIAAIVVIGLVLAVIIGFVVGQKKKKSY